MDSSWLIAAADIVLMAFPLRLGVPSMSEIGPGVAEVFSLTESLSSRAVRPKNLSISAHLLSDD